MASRCWDFGGWLVSYDASRRLQGHDEIEGLFEAREFANSILKSDPGLDRTGIEARERSLRSDQKVALGPRAFRFETRNGHTSERTYFGTDILRNGHTSERTYFGTDVLRNGRTSERTCVHANESSVSGR